MSDPLKLSNGLELRFSQLMVWDVMEYQAQFGEKIAEEVAAWEGKQTKAVEVDENGNERRPPTPSEVRGTHYLIYCAAKRGGYKGSFEEFWGSVPVQDQARVTEAALPFLGKPEGSG